MGFRVVYVLVCICGGVNGGPESCNYSASKAHRQTDKEGLRSLCYYFLYGEMLRRSIGDDHRRGEGCKGDGRFISTMGVFLLEGSLDRLF